MGFNYLFVSVDQKVTEKTKYFLYFNALDPDKIKSGTTLSHSVTSGHKVALIMGQAQVWV